MGRENCDRCGAEAKVLVDLPSGSQLAFCGHHWTANKAAVEPIAVAVEHLEEVSA
jgi:hypothetical protein